MLKFRQAQKATRRDNVVKDFIFRIGELLDTQYMKAMKQPSFVKFAQDLRQQLTS
jgi:hypothetical protein